jgi:hypothetical protein
VVIAGGHRIFPEIYGNSEAYNDVSFGASWPLDNNSWRVVAEEVNDVSDSWAIEAWAICANVAP